MPSHLRVASKRCHNIKYSFFSQFSHRLVWSTLKTDFLVSLNLLLNSPFPSLDILRYVATKYWTTQKTNLNNVLELTETVTLNKFLIHFCQKKNAPADLIWRNLCKKYAGFYWNKNNIYVTFSGNYSYSSGMFRDLKPF